MKWKHLDIEGETYDSCYDTGENLSAKVKRLYRELQSQGVQVEYIETKLNNTQIPQSNVILFNGIPIKSILNITVAENHCESCTSLLGKDTYCQTITFEDNTYEDIPDTAIRQATCDSTGSAEPAGKWELALATRIAYEVKKKCECADKKIQNIK